MTNSAYETYSTRLQSFRQPKYLTDSSNSNHNCLVDPSFKNQLEEEVNRLQEEHLEAVANYNELSTRASGFQKNIDEVDKKKAKVVLT